MKRILSASLASLLLLSALASCGGGNEKTPETSAPASGGAVSGGAVSGAADTTETEAGYLGEKNLDGFTFTVNARGGKTGNGTFAVKDLWVEGSTGEPINDAVYDRNALMESKYNFEIVQIESAADQLPRSGRRAARATRLKPRSSSAPASRVWRRRTVCSICTPSRRSISRRNGGIRTPWRRSRSRIRCSSSRAT